MSKFERVLSDEEVDNIVKNTTILLGRSIARSKDFILRVEQAVLAKLAEQQEPVAWVIDGSKGLDNSYVTQREAEAKAMIALGSEVEPLYAHPMPCVSPTSDKTACVSESGESEMQELPPLPKPNCRSPSGIGYFDSFTKDQMTDYAKSAIDHHRTAKNSDKPREE